MLCWVSLQEARRYQHLADYVITVPSYGLHAPQHVPIASYAIPDSAQVAGLQSILSLIALHQVPSSPGDQVLPSCWHLVPSSANSPLHPLPCTGALCPALVHCALHFTRLCTVQKLNCRPRTENTRCWNPVVASNFCWPTHRAAQITEQV